LKTAFTVAHRRSKKKRHVILRSQARGQCRHQPKKRGAGPGKPQYGSAFPQKQKTNDKRGRRGATRGIPEAQKKEKKARARKTIGQKPGHRGPDHLGRRGKREPRGAVGVFNSFKVEQGKKRGGR